MPNSPDKLPISTSSTKNDNGMLSVKVPAKAYAWEFILYPDDPNFAYQLGRICELASHWCYIEHWCDLCENEDDDPSDTPHLKKRHFHFHAYFDNQRHRTALCGELFGDKRHTSQIQHIQNKVMALRYLLHLDDPEKPKYNRAEVVFSDYSMRDTAFDAWDRLIETHETTPLVAILAFIEESGNRVRFAELLHFALSIGAYAEYRRSYSIIRDVLREHNDYIDASDFREFTLLQERKRQLEFRKSRIGGFSEIKDDKDPDFEVFSIFEKGGN